MTKENEENPLTNMNDTVERLETEEKAQKEIWGMVVTKENEINTLNYDRNKIKTQIVQLKREIEYLLEDE